MRIMERGIQMNNNYENVNIAVEDEETPKLRPMMIRIQGAIFAVAIIAFGFFANIGVLLG